MIYLRRRSENPLPYFLGSAELQSERSEFRVIIDDPEPSFQSHPMFADRYDAQWFLSRAWNQTPPPVGKFRGRSVVTVEADKYVLLHRYGEGVIFNPEGTSNSPGFLDNMARLGTLPIGMSKDGDTYTVDPRILEQCPRLYGNYAIFFNGNLQNYYHWLVEGMLSLELIKAAGQTLEKTVFPEYLPVEGQFDHMAVMALLGHGHLSVTRSSYPYVWCEAVTHLEDYGVDAYPGHYLRLLQTRISGQLAPLQTRTKLLIMRRDLRSVSNVSTLMDFLAPLGFLPYFLEGMRIDEQAELFASASFVVAPHGAGLSNLIFAPPDCKVIELSPDCEMRPFFWEISCKLGHVYGMLPCPTHDGGFNGRLNVDFEKFRVLFSLVDTQR